MRPAVDVVIPFRGSRAALGELQARLRKLQLGPRDTVTVVDNAPVRLSESSRDASPPGVLRAGERQSAYHARNRGAGAGSADWLVFLDADVDSVPDLIDRYFAQPPDDSTAVLIGAVRDQIAQPGHRESIAARYARLRGLMDHDNNLLQDRPYAKTANCAIRRAAFDGIGGFCDDVRSGGDADICFRLSQAGWTLETRLEAQAVHRARRRLVDLLGQRARHGSGGQWLEQAYPGFVGSRVGTTTLVKSCVVGSLHALRCIPRGDVDEAVVRFLDPLSSAAFEIGRHVSNRPWREQPLIGGILRVLDRPTQALAGRFGAS